MWQQKNALFPCTLSKYIFFPGRKDTERSTQIHVLFVILNTQKWTHSATNKYLQSKLSHSHINKIPQAFSSEKMLVIQFNTANQRTRKKLHYYNMIKFSAWLTNIPALYLNGFGVSQLSENIIWRQFAMRPHETQLFQGCPFPRKTGIKFLVLHELCSPGRAFLYPRARAGNIPSGWHEHGKVKHHLYKQSK